MVDWYFDEGLDWNGVHVHVVIPAIEAYLDGWRGEFPTLMSKTTMTPEDYWGDVQLAVQILDPDTDRRWAVLHTGDMLPGMILTMRESLEPLLRDAMEVQRQEEYDKRLREEEELLIPLPAFDAFPLIDDKVVDWRPRAEKELVRAINLFLEGALDDGEVEVTFADAAHGRIVLTMSVRDPQTKRVWSITSTGEDPHSLGAYGLEALKRIIWPELDDENRFYAKPSYDGLPS